MDMIEAITSNSREKILPEPEKEQHKDLEVLEIMELLEANAQDLEMHAAAIKYMVCFLKKIIEDIAANSTKPPVT